MKRDQFKAMLWVRWRILANRISRRGKISNVLFALLLIVGVLFSLGAGVLAYFVGVKELPDATPIGIFGVWVGLAGVFLFFWMVGLMTELSRSDSLSFKNLLPLPVSLGWVFVFNYLSSFISLSIVLFLPAMLGLALAMTMTFGAHMLLSFPLILGFFVLVTALTYHLRGWLARLMEDKRKGKNVLMGITFCFVLLMQVPNFINMSRGSEDVDYRAEKFRLKLVANREVKSEEQAAAAEQLQALLAQEELDDIAFEGQVVLATQVIPFGWLPYGMHALFRTQIVPAGLCILGFFLLGGLSLRRSYRTTMRAVVEGVGHGSSKKEVLALPDGASASALSKSQGNLLVERNLPWVGNATAGIAFANLRSLLRAPETKMVMLGPIIIFGLMGLMMAKNESLEDYSFWAPGMSLGAISVGLISINQLLQNQFGLDRMGFRAFLLSPVPRYKILLGKNLTLAPFAIGISWVALLGLHWFVRLDATHLLGALLQTFSAYLLLCLLGNMLSIYAPIRMREMGTKAVKPKFSTFVLQFLTILFVPLTLSPLLLPWGVEFMFGGGALPLYLIMQAIMLLLVTLLYRWFLRLQGEILQNREQGILDILTRD